MPTAAHEAIKSSIKGVLNKVGSVTFISRKFRDNLHHLVRLEYCSDFKVWEDTVKIPSAFPNSAIGPISPISREHKPWHWLSYFLQGFPRGR